MQISLVNGVKQETISIFNNSTNFGDGVFETCKVKNGVILNFDCHIKRLKIGLKTLNINLDSNLLLQELQQVLTQVNNCVLRIIINRGTSIQGYGHNNKTANRIILTSDLPIIKNNINLDFCQSGYCYNQKLASIKHQNRLEQILAKGDNEDCIMLDEKSNIISTTMANIFIIKDNILFTPKLDKCGIAGTKRTLVIDTNQVIIKRINKVELLNADEVFITNAVIGIISVIKIQDIEFDVKLTQQISAKIQC